LHGAGGAAASSAPRAASGDARNALIRDVLPFPGDIEMTSKPNPKDTKKNPATPHPGMMGDGTEEQNLGQPGNPAARIKKDEVDAAFAKDGKKK
jgi:hypothetical protein